MEDGNPMKRTASQAAVVIRDAYKQYTSNVVVLKGLNLTVPVGCIYGLLGPSGCGKSTLLRCIVAMTKLDSGTVQLNITKHSEIGYMPQSLCIHDLMTVSENCFFYGYLHGMASKDIRVATEDLVSVLELPSDDRLVKDLSGGQQKRVSMAVTFIHDPKILILDEPTVGLDLMLTDKLWKRFLEMTAGGKTIIITTHYIQEARQAHKVGLMRNGVLLTEKTPAEVIREAGPDCTNLEDAFLQLSSMQEQGVKSAITDQSEKTKVVKVRYKDDDTFPIHKFAAITYKNFVSLKRDFKLTCFILLLPGLVMLMGNLSIGGAFRNLHLAVVNEETHMNNCWSMSYNACFLDVNATVYLSCLYLKFVREKSFILVEYPDIQTAQENVRTGQVSALLHFSKFYSSSLYQRLENGMDTKHQDVENASVNAWIDFSNPFIGNSIKHDLMITQEDYLAYALVRCNMNPKIGLRPIKFEEHVFGSSDFTFTPYAINGLMTLCSFFFPAFMSLVNIHTEKSGGIEERIMVTGISKVQMLLALLFFLMLLFMVELAQIVLIPYFMFNQPLHGSLLTVVTLLLFNGISGFAFGFLLTVMYDDLMLATFSGGGALLALALVSGIGWPLEGQHYLLRTTNWLLPVIRNVAALQDVYLKGFTVSELSVIIGYLSSIQWTCTFTAILYLWPKVFGVK